MKKLFDALPGQIPDKFRFNFDEPYPFGTSGIDSCK